MTSPEQLTMLIAYDGSEEARQALVYAARLLRPTNVEILTAWEPQHRSAVRNAGMSGLPAADWGGTATEEDEAYIEAKRLCSEGAQIAEQHGLRPRAHLVESTSSTWSAIVDACVELRPDVIVSGTKAESGWRSVFKNSTATSLVHHVHIPVFVVPPLVDEDIIDGRDSAASAEAAAEQSDDRGLLG